MYILFSYQKNLKFILRAKKQIYAYLTLNVKKILD